MASVLVVDDEADIRELLRINLELDGHQVVTAPDGRRALECILEQAPDVVVLDVVMPGMDGWEVLRHIKADRTPEVATVPVIMLTARHAPLDRLQGTIEGAIRYMTKPFSVDELRHEVSAALEGDPEPVRRRRLQHEALEELARMEKGEPAPVHPTPRPHLTRLEGQASARAPSDAAPVRSDQVQSLSPSQRRLLRAVATTPTVRAAAEQLEISRTNVYAGLRRVGRKLGVPSVPELIALARQGGIPGLDD